MESACAMDLVPQLLPAGTLEPEGFEGWFAGVEDYVTALGCRCQLVHISAGEWQRAFYDGLTAQDAVLAELAGVAD